jgi:enoyl-CoA hydratase/carnithine racemase
MLKVEELGDVRVLRLSRPPVNALNQALLEQFTTAIREAPAAGARGLVLTGEADCYCAGLDVRALIACDAAMLTDFLGAFLDCLQALAASTVPVVAAINGHSPAGGAVLALHCDWRVMRDGETRIGLNEVAVGLCPGPLIHAVLTETVGPRVAARLLTSGALVNAAEALSIGLVDELAPADEVTEVALRWLRSRLDLPPYAYQTTRRMVRADLVALLDEVTGPGRQAALDALQRDWLHPETRTTLEALLLRRASGR